MGKEGTIRFRKLSSKKGIRCARNLLREKKERILKS